MSVVEKITSRHPPGYWSNVNNQCNFMSSVGAALGYSSMEDWYNITRKDICKYGGSGLLFKYNDSPSKVVMDLFSYHKWEPWKFHRKSRGYWKDKDNQLNFLQFLGDKLGFKSKDDFYKLTVKDIETNGGGYLLSKYGNSPNRMLSSIFGGEWELWKFGQVPSRYWNDYDNCLSFMKSLGKKLDFQDNEDWYKLTEKDVEQHGGLTLLHKFGDSPSDLVKNIFSDHNWLVWKFKKLPQSYFSSVANLREYFHYIEKELHIDNIEDWYRVSLSQISYFGSTSFMNHYRGLFGALTAAFPEHEWSHSKFRSMHSSKKSQRWLLLQLYKLFPHLSISNFEEEFVHPTLKYTGSSESITVDVYIAPLNLALEFHGAQHYNITSMGSVLKQQDLDNEKKAKLEAEGLSYIAIPYWWDMKLESLAATIARTRPEVVNKKYLTAIPIPVTISC